MDDYDRWAQVTGDAGWSWKNLMPYILKVGSLLSYVVVSLRIRCPRMKDGLPHRMVTTLEATSTHPCMDLMD
jgi:choline dehydrogenase-like flavoprotein